MWRRMDVHTEIEKPPGGWPLLGRAKKIIKSFNYILRIAISLLISVPNNKISLHLDVHDNQISLQICVPDNTFFLHFSVRTNTQQLSAHPNKVKFGYQDTKME